MHIVNSFENTKLSRIYQHATLTSWMKQRKKTIGNLSDVILLSEQICNLKRQNQHPMILLIVYNIYSGCFIGIQWVFEGL